jgi:hypothetical protein
VQFWKGKTSLIIYAYYLIEYIAAKGFSFREGGSNWGMLMIHKTDHMVMDKLFEQPALMKHKWYQTTVIITPSRTAIVIVAKSNRKGPVEIIRKFYRVDGIALVAITDTL